MAYNANYKGGASRFYYALAQDAITNYLSDKPATRAYIEERLRAIEGAESSGDPDEVDRALDRNTGAANALVDQVKAATGDTFSGTTYNQLVSAAHSLLGIDW